MQNIDERRTTKMHMQARSKLRFNKYLQQDKG